MSDQGTIQSTKDFANTPQGQQQYWGIEIKAALDDRKDFLADADEAVKRYRDDRASSEGSSGPKSRLNLYHANLQTLRALLYGKEPSVDVGRRFNDSQDDVARVAAEMQERILNSDIEMDDGFKAGLRYALEDWTGPGLGQLWMRYETGEIEEEPGQPAKMGPCDCVQQPIMTGMGQMPAGRPDPACPGCQGSGEKELAPAVPPTQKRPNEDVDADYTYWRDFLWSPARTWDEVRWGAKRCEMTRDQAVKRFGEKGKEIHLKNNRPGKEDERLGEAVKDAWSRAEVWEIWCKETRSVHWFSEGMDQLLDSREDPLGLDEFFPFPRPLMANVTTGKLMPIPDFKISKDLYNEIDALTYRIKRLEDMAQVRWCYDAQNEPLKRLFDETNEGQGIPVKNWGMWTEKGGIAKAMEFAPLAEIAQAIEVLTTKRAEKIQLLYQITGMSDVMRGQGRAGKTATETSIEAQFTSVRSQTAQDELARFASDCQRIRAEIISKHFDRQTILDRSNVLNTADADKAEAALALIQSDFWRFRIAVRPESLALPDMATQRQERTEAITGLGSYFQAMMPLVEIAASQPQAMAAVLGFVTKTGQWMVAGLKGASEVEEAFDKFANQVQQMAQQPPPPPPPDPAAEAAKVQAQTDMQQTQMDGQLHAAQTHMDLQASQAEHQMKMREMAMKGVQQRIAAETQMKVNASKPAPSIGGK